MGQYQRLLLVADQTLHQSPAMLRAMALAKASGAALDVRAFVEPVPVAHLWEERIDEVDAQRYLRRYRRWIADEVERLNGHGLKVTVDVVFTTHPLLEILRTVQALKPDLLIKDVALEPVLKRCLSRHLIVTCCVNARCRCTWSIRFATHYRIEWSRRWIRSIRPRRSTA